METLTNHISNKQQAIAKANRRKKRLVRLAAEPIHKTVHTRSFGNPSRNSKYQEHGKYKRAARGTRSISDKMMVKLGIH